MSKNYLKDTKTFLLVFSYQLAENEKNINTDKYHDSVGPTLYAYNGTVSTFSISIHYRDKCM